MEKKAKYLTDELEIDEDDADDIIDAMKTAGTVQFKHQHYSHHSTPGGTTNNSKLTHNVKKK